MILGVKKPDGSFAYLAKLTIDIDGGKMEFTKDRRFAIEADPETMTALADIVFSEFRRMGLATTTKIRPISLRGYPDD